MKFAADGRGVRLTCVHLQAEAPPRAVTVLRASGTRPPPNRLPALPMRVTRFISAQYVL